VHPCCRSARDWPASIALTSCPSEQLPIVATRLVILRQDDVQAPCISHIGVEFDVGATASHIGSNRHPTRLPRAGHDFGFLAVLSCVEYGRLQACFEEQLADVLRSVGPSVSRSEQPVLAALQHSLSLLPHPI
jgi:hypothetical protein